MENELIKITTKDGKQLVSARELHEFLGLSKRFSAWFETYKSEDYGFIEGEDFMGCTQKYTANQYGAISEREDYAITIEMAKELSMLSKSKKGKEARKYFIACEKKLKEVAQFKPQLPTDYLSALKALVASEEEKQRIALQLEENKEKVDKWDKFLNTDGLIKIGDFGKVIGIGRNKLYKKLRDMNILQCDNIPYQRYIKYFEVKQTIKNNKTFNVTLINKVGIDYLSNKLKAC